VQMKKVIHGARSIPLESLIGADEPVG
jgi:hypothetical protein